MPDDSLKENGCKQKSPALSCRAFANSQLDNTYARLRRLDVGGLLALGTLNHIEGDLLPFFE
jgi:hypothetical protein